MTLAPELPERLLLDPVRLEQLLTNLLSNACKYTARGSVSLRVECVATRLIFSVSDSGAGISADLLPKLFTPYVTQGADAPPVAEGSTGLGLAICRQLVQRMGGSIALHSEPGRGTVARVELPLREPITGTVLVCDDDPTSRLLMSEMLRQKGYPVEEAPDGQRALVRWRLGGIGALITDLDMPSLPGMELIAALRSEEGERSAGTAIIVCSGSPLPGGQAEPAAAVHDAYLMKPVHMQALSEALQRLGVLPQSTQAPMNQRRQLLSHLCDARHVHLGHDHTLAFFQHGQHLAPGVDDHAVAPGAAAIFMLAALR